MVTERISPGGISQSNHGDPDDRSDFFSIALDRQPPARRDWVRLTDTSPISAL
jgi:hypothetical protein